MNLKYKYLIFIGLIHVVLVILVYQLLNENKWLFIGSELLIILSLFLSYRLYRSFIKPLELLKTGTDAIADADYSTKYLKTGSKDIDGLVEVFNNMIERLREERINLAEQSYFVQNLIEVTPLGIIIMNYDGGISNINPSAKRILGIKSYSPDKKMDKDNELAKVILAQKVGSSELITINGVDKYKCQVEEVIHQGFKRKFILVDDLSRELQKTEKEAFGRIIRMMAHEVNNSMGAINSIIDTVIEFGFDEKSDQKLVDSLYLVKDRNLGLSQFMANYASVLRLPKTNKEKIDLCVVLKKCGQLFIPNSLEKNILIKFELPDEPIIIQGDVLLLEQAISNIIKNAKEAIGSDGEIIVRAIDSPKGFSIIDNGKGISQEAAAQLFTPFFSTKVDGQGVGLMLIRDILETHKAKFKLATDSRSGLTHFDVTFN